MAARLSDRRGSPFAVVGAVAVGLLVSLAFWSHSDGTSNDSFECIRGGQTLWSGQGYKDRGR